MDFLALFLLAPILDLEARARIESEMEPGFNLEAEGRSAESEENSPMGSSEKEASDRSLLRGSATTAI